MQTRMNARVSLRHYAASATNNIAGESPQADSSPELNQNLVKIEEVPNIEYDHESQLRQINRVPDLEASGPKDTEISETNRHPDLDIDFEHDSSASQEAFDLYIHREIPTVACVYIKGSV